MKIDCIEIKNFRKLKSTHLDFDEKTTLLVGANNSGKTSAMLALRYFLLSPKSLSLRDITIGNWRKINNIGADWENDQDKTNSISELLPSLDVWLSVPLSHIHRVVHILPSINWNGGPLGVRLQYEPLDTEKLREAYRQARLDATAIIKAAPTETESLRISPRNLTEFLEKELTRHIGIKAYVLDPSLRCEPKNGVASPQALPESAIALTDQPFNDLIKIDEIVAQRELSDADNANTNHLDGDAKPYRSKRRLTDQLRGYFDRHLDPLSNPTADDIRAVAAIQSAEKAFNKRLRVGFDSALKELGEIGYPGVNNPSIDFNTQLKPTDGLKHNAAVQYQVADPTEEGEPVHLPESYAGLGYQNLISMVFMLMSFRDDWMRHLISNDLSLQEDEDTTTPLHLVLIEEPEAHLHAQVQQVFIKKAYKLLRNHSLLGKSKAFATQLVVSTHSSHVAHEVDFSNLRYFRRHQAKIKGEAPTTTVTNLSHIFGSGDDTLRFVKRYLKATHCDLFFADAAIFVEGQAERILLPHFIRSHYPDLWCRYTSLIDLGGAHAHRFKSLVEGLGLTTLVISDLDSAQEAIKLDRNGNERTVYEKIKPSRNDNQVTTNPVLKSWHPSISSIDALLDLDNEKHAKKFDNNYYLYVAYQKEVPSPSGESSEAKIIPRTFEDALIYNNMQTLKTLSGSAISNKVRKLVASNLSESELEEELFELLKEMNKASFALDCLVEIEEPEKLHPPEYIAAGLKWLQDKLAKQEIDNLSFESRSDD